MSNESHARRRRTHSTGVCIAAASLVFAACSSGSDDAVSVPIPDPTQAETPVSTEPTANDTVPPTAPATVPATTSAPTTEPAATTTEAPPVTAPATPAPTTTAEIVYYSEGDEGPEIEIMQLKLIALGYLDSGLADGVFGASTSRALRNFQGQYGLGVDGVFGPLTDRALSAAANSVNVEDG